MVSLAQSLPSVIVENIFAFYAGNVETCINDWFSALPLTGVCRHWRIAAMQLLYRHLHIGSNMLASSSTISDKHAKDGCKYGRFMSNTDLIRITHSQHMVKNACIIISNHELLNAIVDSISSLPPSPSSSPSMYIDTDCLLNVQSVYLEAPTSLQYSFNLAQESNQDIAMKKLQCLVDAISQRTPNAKSLKLNLENVFGVGTALAGVLAQRYSDQLQSLETLLPISLSNQVTFRNLTNIYFKCPSPNSIPVLPLINHRIIQHLTLVNMPTTFMWQDLVRTDKCSAIEFSMLQSLELHIGNLGNRVSDNTMGLVSFPQLNTLSLTLPTLGLITRYFDPKIHSWPNVKSLKIQGIEPEHVLNAFEGGQNENNAADTMNGFGFNTYGHLKGLVQSIAASMPKVTTLGLGDFYEMNQDIPLYNMLAAEYAERLRCISFNCPETIYSVQRFSPHLTSLRFNALSREPWVLSKIDVECLVHLDIDRLTDSFTWERFYNSPKKSTIVFSKLKSLKLNFSTHTRATEQDTGNRIMQLIEYKPITNIACPELESITFANGIYRDLWRLLSFGGNICANLKTLDVVLANSISYDYQFKLNANALEQSIESVAYELASCIPNIKDVRLSSVRTCAATSIFYNAISNGLAHQFVNYTCNTPINFIVPQFSNRLKKLSFHVSPLLQQPFPALNTDTIEHLEINNVQFPFGWEYLFSSQKDSANTVTFGMLESLRINLLSKTLQAPTSPEPVSQLGDVREKVRLYMPNLKQLEICQLQLSSASPNVEIIINRQTNVVFKGTACGLEAIKCDSDAGFKALVVDLHTSKDDEHDFYKATNRVFGVESGIGEKKLALIGDCDWLDTARIKWANLHELHVLTPTCFTLLLGIIAALPNLKQLACAKLLPENTHIKSFYNIAPLSHSILRLVIYSAESSSSQQVNNCIKYLLLATPSLRFVQCPDTSLDRQAFIRQFSLAYPHVKSAQLLRY